MNIRIKKLNEKAVTPQFKTMGAAGFDLSAIETITIKPKESATIDIGLAFEIPEGYELEIRGRSGLAFKNRVLAFNGTIDSDYRNGIKVLLFNCEYEPYTVNAGDRIAQGIIKKIEQVQFIESETLSETERNLNGFGSTGN